MRGNPPPDPPTPSVSLHGIGKPNKRCERKESAHEVTSFKFSLGPRGCGGGMMAGFNFVVELFL